MGGKIKKLNGEFGYGGIFADKEKGYMDRHGDPPQRVFYDTLFDSKGDAYHAGVSRERGKRREREEK